MVVHAMKAWANGISDLRRPTDPCDCRGHARCWIAAVASTTL